MHFLFILGLNNANVWGLGMQCHRLHNDMQHDLDCTVVRVDIPIISESEIGIGNRNIHGFLTNR